MSFLERITECNSHDLSGFRPFSVAGTRVGWVRHQFAELLAGFGDVFEKSSDGVKVAAHLGDYAARTEAVDWVVQRLAADGIIDGWRGEPYPVGTGFHEPAFFEMERAAVPHFGVPAYGVHINGFFRRGFEIHMWIGRRAACKATFPGMLDNMIAGGQPVGLGLAENVVKEAGEEAGVPPELAQGAVPVGAISYCCESADGLKPDVMFCYDLELPEDFIPRNTDGEISEFMLLPAAEVMEITAATGEFKFNCNLVNIDFFIRHGLLTPDHPDYVDILRGLHW
ncbi:MAG: DUF4743 domain-containing protein [Alphaproteobacteria bacterium]